MSEKRLKFDFAKFITKVGNNAKNGNKTTVGGILLAGVTSTSLLYSAGSPHSDVTQAINDNFEAIITIIAPIVLGLIGYGKK